MSLEDFQLIDTEPIDNSNLNRDFLKVYHQEGANLENSDQNVEFIFREINNYQQIGTSYLQFNKTVREADNKNFNETNDPATNGLIRLVNNGFSYCFKEGRLATTGATDLQHKKYVGQIFTIMRTLTNKDADLLSHVDNIDESQNRINNTSLKHMLNNNHNDVNSHGKINGHLPREHIFGFCKSFKKITKNLGVHLTFKTGDLQDIIYTTIVNPINITIYNLYLFVPMLIPNIETQAIFTQSMKNNYTISVDPWSTKRKIVNDGS